MNKKLLLGLSAIMLTTTLSGCSQVHFGRDAVTIGTPQKAKPKVEHKKVAKKEKAATSSSKKSEMKTTKKVEKTKSKGKNKKKSKTKSKTKKVVKTDWTVAKTKKLQAAVNNWSKATGQTYRFYDGVHPLKTKKGDTYPQAFTQARFVLKKKPIKIGWSPLGKNKYQYNVVQLLMITLNLGIILIYSV